jgi:dolichol-phosphate mannosyltransferase
MALMHGGLQKPRTNTAATIVVPIFKEQANIRPLLEALHSVAVKSSPLEVLFVDDSPNEDCLYETDRAIEYFDRNGACKHLSIRHVLRTDADTEGGLSSAVILGMQLASNDFVVVMDGDLQHPPQLVPELIKHLDDGDNGIDLVATTRYAKGGSSKGLSSGYRVFVSRASTLLAKTLFPKGLRSISDPMTGYFAVNRTKLHLDQDAAGYKILLKFLQTHPELSRTEIPFEFGERQAGESNATLKQGLKFIDQLVYHRLENPIVSFIVGGVAIGGLGSLLLSALTRLGLPEVWAYAIQFLVTVCANFVFNRRYTWRNESEPKLKRQATMFGLTRAATFFGSVPAFSVLLAHGVHHQAAYMGLLLAGGVFNYFSSRYIFTRIVNN